VQTLHEAVQFYDSFQFNSSPGGALVGGISLTSPQIDDLVAFLESLDELPFTVAPKAVQFGAQDVDGGATGPVTVTITSAGPLTVNSVALGGGPHDDQFEVSVLSATEVEVAFDPTSPGLKQAILELDTDAGDVGVPLRGVGIIPGFPSFGDVLPGDFGFSSIEAIFAAGITAGCGGGNFCPNAVLPRAQIAVLLARAMGLFDVPPRGHFSDVSPTDFGAGFIERLAEENVTAGCGGGKYCPNEATTRAQAAVLVAKASGRTPIVPQTGVFADVPPGSFGAGFIERLAADGITVGCGGGNYCPNTPITRAQIAVFIAKAFGLVP